MLPNKPYLLRAFYEWIVDSACTPILVIDALNPFCKIPKNYIEDGEIIFNISSYAVRDLKLGNEAIEFKASFSGIIHIISVPMSAILAIYAEENNEEGIFFDPEEYDADKKSVVSSSGPFLKEIENSNYIDTSEIERPFIEARNKSKPILKLVE